MIKPLIVYFAIITNVIFAQSQSGEYTIESLGTQTFLQTAPPVGGPLTLGSAGGIWKISPPLGPETTNYTISHPVFGYYAGLKKASPFDEYVITVPDPYYFTITRASTGYYSISIPRFGVFWTSNSTISPFIQLISGSEVRGNDGYFNIVPAQK
ncbi:uncharacterized protein BX664DRAFT_369973 [Halteromyces radiatus]|uniref:uncharacterized protein n=1 Tax=Halteromyces radiatus TaxID=101107 RepID=UPI00221EEECB|nr:uncharacterized protein BX664DRAFT_369973 [Halteromyces radiatus]KAI8096276.1 hypothetical protein BX664DRAFT_369973 [Halteromyces radiatus]